MRARCHLAMTDPRDAVCMSGRGWMLWACAVAVIALTAALGGGLGGSERRGRLVATAVATCTDADCPVVSAPTGPSSTPATSPVGPASTTSTVAADTATTEPSEESLTDAEYVAWALMAAADLEAALDASVGVRRTTGHVPGFAGTDASITPDTRIVTVTVYAPIPANHSAPRGAVLPDFYDAYSIWYRDPPGPGGMCYGCTAVGATGTGREYVDALPEAPLRSRTRWASTTVHPLSRPTPRAGAPTTTAASMLALAEGTARLNGHCVELATATGTVGLILPAGVTADDQGIQFADGTRLSFGPWAVGGGYVSASTADVMTGGLASIVCRGYDEYFQTGPFADCCREP